MAAPTFSFTTAYTQANFAWVQAVAGSGIAVFQSWDNTDLALIYTANGTSFSTKALVSATKTLQPRGAAYNPTTDMFLWAGISQVQRMSGDLSTIYARTTVLNTAQFTGVVWAPALGLYLLAQGSPANATIRTSPDGVTWTNRAAGVSTIWNDIEWSNDLGIAVAVGNGYISWSNNGVSWNPVAISGAGNITSIVYSPTLKRFVATCTNGILWSNDGKVWTRVAITGLSRVEWCSGFGTGTFVAVGNGTCYASDDGKVWSARSIPAENWQAIAYLESTNTLLVGSYDTGKILRTTAATAPPPVNGTIAQSFGSLTTTINVRQRLKTRIDNQSFSALETEIVGTEGMKGSISQSFSPLGMEINVGGIDKAWIDNGFGGLQTSILGLLSDKAWIDVGFQPLTTLLTQDVTINGSGLTAPRPIFSGQLEFRAIKGVWRAPKARADINLWQFNDFTGKFTAPKATADFELHTSLVINAPLIAPRAKLALHIDKVEELSGALVAPKPRTAIYLNNVDTPFRRSVTIID